MKYLIVALFFCFFFSLCKPAKTVDTPVEQKLEEVVVAYGTEKRESPQSAPLSLQDRASGIAIFEQKYPSPDHEYNTEDYDHITENRFRETTTNPLSTFSVDVDGASYSNV